MRVLWSKIKLRPKAWRHIQTSIAGSADVAKCVECKQEVQLEGHFNEKDVQRERSSVLLEFARKHYYKHKVWEKFSIDTTTV